MSFVTMRAARKALPGALAALVAVGGVAVPAGTASAAIANLVPNGSAETVARGAPKGWVKGVEGKNGAVLGLFAKGGASGPRFVRTRITSYRSGAAWWATPVAAVRGGTTYKISERYRSNAVTRLRVGVTVRGKLVWTQIGTVRPAKAWATASWTVTLPAGATAVRVAHTLRSAGTLDVDGVSLVAVRAAGSSAGSSSTGGSPSTGGSSSTGGSPTTPQQPGGSGQPAAAGKGLVSLTFDDGTADHYATVLPLLRAAGKVATFYVVSGYLGADNYLSVDQGKELQAAGNEIGSHTVDHQDLSDQTPAQAEAELADSKRVLESHFGPVTDLAYPFGSSTAAVRQLAAKYYASARSTDGGVNVSGQYDRYRLTIGYVLNTTSLATVQQWIADAQAKGTWLILCYHGVNEGMPDETYNVSPATLSSHLAAIKTSGIRTVTVRDGLGLISS
jgi:peptidoglycan/xylan/chitin deacetylase (PgdA/CDA1 family)